MKKYAVLTREQLMWSHQICEKMIFQW